MYNPQGSHTGPARCNLFAWRQRCLNTDPQACNLRIQIKVPPVEGGAPLSLPLPRGNASIETAGLQEAEPTRLWVSQLFTSPNAQRARRSATMHITLHWRTGPLDDRQSCSRVRQYGHHGLQQATSPVPTPGYQACRGHMCPPSLPRHCIISGETREPPTPILSALRWALHEEPPAQIKSSQVK